MEFLILAGFILAWLAIGAAVYAFFPNLSHQKVRGLFILFWPFMLIGGAFSALGKALEQHRWRTYFPEVVRNMAYLPKGSIEQRDDYYDRLHPWKEEARGMFLYLQATPKMFQFEASLTRSEAKAMDARALLLDFAPDRWIGWLSLSDLQPCLGSDNVALRGAAERARGRLVSYPESVPQATYARVDAKALNP